MGIYNWNTLQCITLQQIKRITTNCFYIYWQLSCQMKFESSALHFVLEYTHTHTTQSISIPSIFFKLCIVTGFKKIQFMGCQSGGLPVFTITTHTWQTHSAGYPSRVLLCGALCAITQWFYPMGFSMKTYSWAQWAQRKGTLAVCDSTAALPTPVYPCYRNRKRQSQVPTEHTLAFIHQALPSCITACKSSHGPELHPALWCHISGTHPG